jgi:hypothetical protein
MDKSELLKLADGIDACVEDALKPVTIHNVSNWPMGEVQHPSHGVVCLCNAMERIADALRALTKEDS